jgi:probable addiction module antidote protein
MKNIKVTKWDVLDYLNDENKIALYLQAASMENDANALVVALGDVAKARGINNLAKDMGVSRESLYKSFSGNVKPKFETIYNALDKLGFHFSVVPNLNT